MSGDASLLEGKPALALDFNYFVEDNIVVIDEADAREQQGYVLSLCGALYYSANIAVSCLQLTSSQPSRNRRSNINTPL